MSSRQTFSPEVMPEVECTRKIAISISDIWAFDRCSSYNIDGDISISKFDLLCDLNDVMNMYLWKCSHYLMTLTHRKFNDDIFACFPVIAKNVISFIKEHRRPTLRLPCDVIDNVIIIKNFFGIIWDVIIISEIKLKLCSIIENFQNGHSFRAHDKFFLLEVIPEVEYTRKIAICIFDILSFCSTL